MKKCGHPLHWDLNNQTRTKTLIIKTYNMKFTHLLCVAALAAASAHGATVAWQGGTGNWTDDNWGTGTAPSQTISDAITIGSGTVNVTGNLIAQDGALADQNITVSGDAILNIGGAVEFGTSKSNQNTLAFSMQGTAQVSADYFHLKTHNFSNSPLTFGGGLLTLNSDNPFRGGDFPNQNVNITAAAGLFSIFHTNATTAAKTLATKVGSDLFSIDGTKITVTADGSNVGALNTELALNIVNGKYFQIETSGITQTLVVVSAVPEPSSTALLGLGGFALILRRRR